MNADGTPKCRFHEGHSFYCDGKRHTKRDCSKYNALLKNIGGKRPANYEGAFKKTRKPFGEKHGSASTGGLSR